MGSIVAQERSKYEKIWAVPEYDTYSPGMENVERFMSVLDPEKLETLIDIGCGAGKASLEFMKRGLVVHSVDITDAGLVPNFPRSRFIQSPLWDKRWTLTRRDGWDYGFCCDVMEHIPPEYTMLVADRIMSCCRTAWFQICLVPDQFGMRIGEPLHLTVQPSLECVLVSHCI